MQRLLIIGASVVFILALGGMWLVFSRDTAEDYSNVPLSEENLMPSSPLTQEDKQDDEVVPAPEASPDPTPPPSAAPTTAKTPSLETVAPKTDVLAVTPRLLGYGFRAPEKPRSIDTVVLHSSYNAIGGDVFDVDQILKEYEDYGVGAHYLISRGGTVYRLVEEKNIAYHAGTSELPDGRKNVNDFSIGIELVGTKTSGYTDDQYESLNGLLTDIKKRHRISTIVGHADIAPARKSDPWNFDWDELKK
jgi:hypothetical protein